MRKKVMLDKKIGETPLMAIERWKQSHPSYATTPASYAGRLDPMASGKLLVLLGDECKKQSEYTKLDKTYDIEVLLDIGSDTGDVLGIVSAATPTHSTNSEIAEALKKEHGTHTVPYPVFSSKTVKGVPLFMYALRGTHGTIEVPTHPETIYSITLKSTEEISSDALQRRIEELLALAPISDEPSKLLGADFRITEVRKSWKQVFETSRSYTILRLRVSCGSGTYMRSLAGRIGVSLGTNALALSIRRTRIGRGWWGY